MKRIKAIATGVGRVIRLLTPAGEDLLILAGYAGLCYGAWLVYEPLGYLVGGALALIAGIAKARLRAGDKTTA